MMTGLIQDQNLEKQIEKQIGCMSGFLHIFDRQQILAGKPIHSTKRLPPSTGSSVVNSSQIEKTVPVVPAEPVVNSPESADGFPPSPSANMKFFPASTPPRSPLPIFEPKNSWKFCKEMPRLSLDSRATVDSKGSLCAKQIRSDSINGSFEKQGRSPSVIAKLMGLEQLPSSLSSPETVITPELRRSASESRVSRDLFQSRFIDGNNFPSKQTNQQNRESQLVETNQNGRVMQPIKHSSRIQKSELPKTNQWRYPQQKRNFFDSADFFPEPKQTTAISGMNLKLRGVYEQPQDLEALKHILEAMQLKGLLHSINRDSHRNFVYDSNALLVNRRRSPASTRRYSGEISPRKERGVFDRSGRSPVRSRSSPVVSRIEISSKNCITNDKRKTLSIETQKRYRESFESRRNSPINSPKLTPKRSGSEHHSVITNRSPRSKRPSEKIYSKAKVSRTVVAEDESSSVSESSGSTTSQFDSERSKMEEYREGKSLLARCDKLLADMNRITESHTSSNSVLPSPVSVLDSAFNKDESSSPPPVKKRTIDFKDLEDDIWSSIISPAKSNEDDEFISDDSDFKYISEVLRASKYLSDESSVFCFLEQQQYLNGNDSSPCSKLRRKLVFDIVAEILHRNRDLPPWNSISLTESYNSVNQICTEFQKIREPETSEKLLDLICTVLKRDLVGNNGWGDHPVEISEAVLYIERLIFKDLVSETIGDLVDFAGKTTFFAPRRKLVF